MVLKGLPGSSGGNSLPRWDRAWLYDAGYWRYLEHDWIAKPGTYIHEPAGEAHTLVITEDSPEPMIAFFRRGRRPDLSGQTRERYVSLPTRTDSLFSN